MGPKTFHTIDVDDAVHPRHVDTNVPARDLALQVS